MKSSIDSRRRRYLLGWLAAVSLTFVGLIPTVVSPVLGDDLVVIAEGFAARTSGQSVAQYATSYAELMIAGGHVLPVGGFLTALQVSLVEILSRTGLSVSIGWGLSRVTLIIASLVALAVTLAFWMSRVIDRPSKSSFGANSLLVFLLSSSVFIGTLQIHGAWSQDPVLSYALASWGTPALGLIYFLLAGALLRKRNPILLLTGLVTLGIVGFLLYEPFIVAVGAGYVAVLLQVLLSQPNRAQWVRLGLFTGVTLIVSGLFALVQAWRLTQPSDYSGTQAGFRDMIIPTWITGFLSSVPLASTPLALQETELIAAPIYIFGPILVSLLLALGAYRMLRSPGGLQLTTRSAIPPATFLLLLWAGTSLMFATSSKYQLEIGTQLGRTYLFYATGTLAVCGLIAIVLLWLAQRHTRAVIALVVVLVVVAGFQWSINARAMKSIENTYGWTRTAADSLVEPIDVESRCSVTERLQESDIPEFYRRGTINGLTSTFRNQFAQSYCPPMDN